MFYIVRIMSGLVSNHVDNSVVCTCMKPAKNQAPFYCKNQINQYDHIFQHTDQMYVGGLLYDRSNPTRHNYLRAHLRVSLYQVRESVLSF